LCVLSYLGSWLIVYMNLEAALHALANEKRLRLLEWLKEPRTHFPPQVYGDLVRDGVCGVFIARKLQVSQPTASEHLKILQQAGLVLAKRIKQWTFYKRNEATYFDRYLANQNIRKKLHITPILGMRNTRPRPSALTQRESDGALGRSAHYPGRLSRAPFDSSSPTWYIGIDVRTEK